MLATAEFHNGIDVFGENVIPSSLHTWFFEFCSKFLIFLSFDHSTLSQNYPCLSLCSRTNFKWVFLCRFDIFGVLRRVREFPAATRSSWSSLRIIMRISDTFLVITLEAEGNNLRDLQIISWFAFSIVSERLNFLISDPMVVSDILSVCDICHQLFPDFQRLVTKVFTAFASSLPWLQFSSRILDFFCKEE